MKQPLTIQVVTWNSAAVIGDFCRTLRSQPYQDYLLLVIDNASSDETVQIVKQCFPRAALIQNDHNLGFSKAHNQGIAATENELVAVVNPDIRFTSSSLAPLLKRMSDDLRLGSIGPKLLKSGGSSGIIDSAGIIAKRTRQFINRGENETDTGQYDRPEDVFGISGAFVLLRRRALDAVRIGSEYFDEDFFAYKEDIDLAWRLRLAGWRNGYEPNAVAFHERTARHQRTRTILLRGRQKPQHIRALSYRNHLLLLAKNDRARDWFLPLPQVAIYEIGKFIYTLFREPGTTRGALEALRLLPRILKKRAVVKQQTVIPPSIRSQWFD
ncbi:MAG: glycosyltransferase family 2 protein [Candidatus Kerfeldbacteria bacterium]|nr:glycosyltransferase family 2 protein [Candidatus Kerfeldbacteria bacterium]